MDLNREMFDKLVNSSEKPVLVEFMAPWCMYCKRLASTMETVKKQYEKILNIGFVNIDNEPGLEEQEGIELVPTLVLYHGGKRLGVLVNPDSKAKIDRLIAENMDR